MDNKLGDKSSFSEYKNDKILLIWTTYGQHMDNKCSKNKLLNARKDEEKQAKGNGKVSYNKQKTRYL